MVKKRIQLVLLLVVAAASLVVLYQRFFPNDEKLIRRRLDNLARIACVPEGPTPAGSLAAGDRLRDFLTSNVVLDLDLLGDGRHRLAGRQEIIQAAVAIRNSLGGLKVEFLDVQVALDAEHQNATVELTLRATQPGRRDIFAQEVKVHLMKEDQQWRIDKAETVRTLTL
jgi:hypothetical protein